MEAGDGFLATAPVSIAGLGDGVRVNLHSGNGFVPTSILGGEALENLASRLVGSTEVLLLDGRAPAWLYAGVALSGLAVGGKARPIILVHDLNRLESSQQARWVVVEGSRLALGSELDEGFRVLDGPPRSLPPLAVRGDPRALRLGFGSPQEHSLYPSMLGDLPRELSRQVPADFNGLLVWDERAPVWLQVAFCLWAWQHRPRASIALHNKQNGGDVVVASSQPEVNPGMVLPVQGDGKPTLVVGIIGDPNSGKSVLSWKLYYACGQLLSGVYRYDADRIAPTARWMETPQGRDVREKGKRKREWDDERDMPWMLQVIENIRQSATRLALVDLPGGDHSVKPPRRVPPARGGLFRGLDGFILVQKSDEVARGWCEALRAAGVTAPIIAEVLSRSTGDRTTEARTRDEQGRWLPGPLDRETIDTPDPAVSQLAAWLTGYAERWQETAGPS